VGTTGIEEEEKRKEEEKDLRRGDMWPLSVSKLFG
jgi:hypothetical protein